MIKQIACGRRKPEMTRKEYNDHRFQVHGRLSDGPSRDVCPMWAAQDCPFYKWNHIINAQLSPRKYIQTPIFDAAFGARPGGLNLNHPWVGRDDVTELYFRDMKHLQHVFNSEYVKTTIGPDGLLFADFEATMVLMAKEYAVPLLTKSEPTANEGFGTVATYFVATKDNQRDGATLRSNVENVFLQALQENSSGEIYKAEVNVGFVSSEFDLNSYFGGSNMPQYALVYKLFMKDTKSVPSIRRAQKAFEKIVDNAIDISTSFIVFGKEALVMDYDKDILVCNILILVLTVITLLQSWNLDWHCHSNV